MAIVQVWAPAAQQMEIELQDGRRRPMKAEKSGWWRVEVGESNKTIDYSFIVDGSGPFPDPRSPWQPNGVHGHSRTVDHAVYPWTDQGWQAIPLPSAVIYELHIGAFTPAGTFEAAIEKLDHLVALGITHVELMPVAAFSGDRGWGYDGVLLYAPHQAYGGPAGLKALVNACHARGLAVILDVVYNHLGPDGNYLGMYGPYFTEHHKTAWGDAVNLDIADSDEVRRFFIDNALMWLRDYHVDALRLDAVHAILDDSAIHFLEELAGAVRRLSAELGRHLALIAESDRNDPRLLRPPAAGGYGIDAQWNDDFHHSLHVTLTGEREGYYVDFGGLPDLVKALTNAYVYSGTYSPFRRRRHGRSATSLAGHHFLAYSQNHDQIGNRAQGDRLCHLVGPDLAKIGAAIVLTSPFIPMLFMGEEWGASTPFQYFTDFEDAVLGEAVSQGRRQEFAAFGWHTDEVPDPQAVDTFQRSKLDWSEIHNEPHAELLEWYRRLIQLRREIPSLATAPLETVDASCDEARGWIVIDRGEVLVVCNLSGAPQTIPTRHVGGAVRLSSKLGVLVTGAGIEIPGQTAAIVMKS